MKLTREEELRVHGMRAAKAVEAHRRKQEQEEWEAEQKRLDTPGIGCLDCTKTPRQVWNEKDEAGSITLTKGRSGGGMFPSTLRTVFDAPLCAECLRHRAAQLRESRR